MESQELAQQTRRDRVRTVVIVVVAIAATLWMYLRFFQPAPPRHLVIASGADFGLYHRHAQRYKEILAREGVTLQERVTEGAVENLQLLLDPKSGVDLAFMQGGLASPPATDGLVMLASLYYEPVWVFYRGNERISQMNELRGKRIAIGTVGSGTNALARRLLADNGLIGAKDADAATSVLNLGGDDAIEALDKGLVDAAFFVGGVQTPLIQRALLDPAIHLMSHDRADAYARRLSFITRLRLPQGTIDLAQDVPRETIDLMGTKSMLAARAGLHPALINLLVDAAREVHGGQGVFEAAGEFPGTTAVDLRVSPYADQHKRFGSSFLYGILPFWVAAIVERLIVLIVPLMVILVPLLNLLPQVLRWRVHSRIYRWYGELAFMEQSMTKAGSEALPRERWLRDLDRIERAVERSRTPPKFASEVYTLREHIELVRQRLLEHERAQTAAAAAAARQRVG